MIHATRSNWTDDRGVFSFCSTCSVTTVSFRLIRWVSVGTFVPPLLVEEIATTSVFVGSCVFVISVGEGLESVGVFSGLIMVEVGASGGGDTVVGFIVGVAELTVDGDDVG